MQSKEYKNIYLDLYKKFAIQMDDYKTDTKYISKVSSVVETLPISEQIAIRAYYRYGDYHKASEMTKVEQKTFSKSISSAKRHLESPINIATVVPGYYDTDIQNRTTLSLADFNNKQRVINSLNKAGIFYKEQLIKHLSNGWNYLWTIPGCGEGARKLILLALDKWDIKISKLQ